MAGSRPRLAMHGRPPPGRRQPRSGPGWFYSQALADLHRAAGYDPSDRQVIGETAAVYRSLGQPQRALESMQSLLDTYSPGEEPQQVLYWTGLDYMALRRYDDAVTSLTTAVSRDRPTPDIAL